MDMRWILLGPPGSGKGTQAVRLADAFNALHLSTGDLLRKEVAEGTKLGKTAKGFMDRGELVSDELILGMIRGRLETLDNGAAYILDGFPRTEAQAEGLDQMLSELGQTIDRAVLVDVGDEEVTQRLAGRAKAEGRADDTEDVIRRRLEVYREQTAPLIEYYRSRDLLSEINGEQSIDTVFADLKVLGNG
jgi:adenylate kinase